MRYMLEAIYQRPTFDRGVLSSVKNHTYSLSGFNLDAYGNIDFNKCPVVIKSHHMINNGFSCKSDSGIVKKDEWSSKSPVIFILRDPYEVVAGRISKKPSIHKTPRRELLGDPTSGFYGYLQILKAFDDHDGDKLLIRYESLMTNVMIEDSLIKICSFISNNHPEKFNDPVYSTDGINKKVSQFIEKINTHRENSAASYNDGHKVTRSLDDVHYWRRVCGEDLSRRWPDINNVYKICKNFDRDVYSKYIQQYEN